MSFIKLYGSLCKYITLTRIGIKLLNPVNVYIKKKTSEFNNNHNNLTFLHGYYTDVRLKF